MATLTLASATERVGPLVFVAPPESLTATRSRGESSRPYQQRTKLRPMRPKPLMATLTLASATERVGPLVFVAWVATFMEGVNDDAKAIVYMSLSVCVYVYMY